MDKYQESTARVGLKGYTSWPLLLYGLMLASLGIVVGVITSGMVMIRLITGAYSRLSTFESSLLFGGSFAIELGIVLILIDLFALLPGKRHQPLVSFDDIPNKQLTV